MTGSAEQAPTVTELQPTRVPDFFVVGHLKSGTTALHRSLRRHPQIHMPVKEPWFLASELNLRDPPRPPGTGRTPATLEEYLSLFSAARPDQLVGEASALYLWSSTAAARIAELQPAARIVAILREPASFLRSLHSQLVQVYLEPEKNMRKALALEADRRQGRHVPRGYWPGATLYSDFVRYVDQLRRYHDHFSREQVLVLIYDDFRRDNEATVRNILRFLEASDEAPVRTRDINPTVRVRSQRVYAAVHTLASGTGRLPRAVQRTARALAPQALDRQAATAIRDRLLYAKPRPADERLMLELRHRFKDEVVALSEYLGRDLVALWGYDRID
jgi:hypothetical protein